MSLTALSAQMADQGIRRLLVIAGEGEVCLQQANHLRVSLPGDWLWVGESTDWPLHCAPRALTTLLGREFTHAVLDARYGFDVAALAALSGTLKPGSFLVLLTPPLDAWAQRPDNDSCRWSDTAEPIATPRFVEHFYRALRQDENVMLWSHAHPFRPPDFSVRPAWHAATGAPEEEQRAILAELAAMPPGVMVVTAPRGRGKSALAGMHIARLATSAIVTAPGRSATDVLAYYAGEMTFIAPDALLARIARGEPLSEWLVVDEAAAIPGPLLTTLVSAFRYVLLTTTVQGYEGTGQGFLLKFCAGFPHLIHRQLHTPLRWAEGCPLEAFINRVLLFDDASALTKPTGEATILSLDQSAWSTHPSLPSALYRLLASAHYRTSPLDLRRMMDAPGQHFWLTKTPDALLAALWLVEEGGLSAGLSQAVWAGFRRPRGNLVAQSLAAHGGSPLAATLRGLRVSRIAVHPSRQREGLGQALIAHARQHVTGCDYLSVSFGYTASLWHFWQRCGFQLVRLGSHREASSGCYTAMAVLPLTVAGQALAANEQRRLARDLPWLDAWKGEKLPLTVSPETTLNNDDWQELAGFAFAHRPLSSATGALQRLLMQVDLPLNALRMQLTEKRSEADICHARALSGRKALLVAQRQEAASALSLLDPERTILLKAQVRQLQFF
ncbi:GNAT family N-acetyltransferase [Phytobacter diazotrophicus]|uniref:tRNA(Met) cytidine acetyltransferase TmcA n=1 Tax=Phytobacter diazotrophicus TaxID=395631 RepID=UPI00232AC16B|nr:GNAT family N-acetyltransferase [Phytobacter diazotrophicus]MDC0725465.1 GNAT family N-acetyltransferase [Phytobacter diazotrophicus]MDC0733009.1 GNAT family N-acetyltransferase [Phytobacter diazotrophicus]